MVQIAQANPFFRDPTFIVAAPKVDLRGSSANVNGDSVDTSVLKDTTKSVTVGENVVSPGKSFFINLGTSTLGRVELGSDTLFELKNGLERLDSGSLPPLERQPSHSQTHQKSITPNTDDVGTESEDTGQLPLKVSLGFDARTIAKAASENTLSHTVAGSYPTSFLLPNFAIPAPASSGIRLDILA